MIPMQVTGAMPSYGTPPVRRDIFAARDLGMVADGQDMRFGPNAPSSMFRGPTVRSAPGQYAVHPMMPGGLGGPMPGPAPNLGTTRSQRDAGALRWASRHQSPSDGAVVTSVLDQPGGELGVRVQGFPKQPGRPNGPGYAYAPAGQIAANYNKMAAANPSLNLTPFNIGEDGGVTGADGRTPLDAGSLHSSMVQARRAERQQKIESLRGNMRQRLAVRAAQRGNFGPLSSLMRQQVDAQGGADNGGVDHNAVFGLVGDMLKNGGDKLSVKQRSKIMQGLATAMLAGPRGASQIPGLLGGIGDSIVGADRQAKARGNDVTQPLDQDQLAQYRAQFKTPQDFAAFAQSSGMNDQVRNKWLYNLYGPDADVGNDGFAGGMLPHKLKIDPNRNYQAVPQGIAPGIGNWLYDSMFGRQAMGQPGNLARPFAKMFGMTAPPPVVGPAPRGGGSPPVPGSPGGAMPPQQQPLIPGRSPGPSWGGSGRPWQSAYGGPPGAASPAVTPPPRQAPQGNPAAQQPGMTQGLDAVTSLDSNSVMDMLGKRPPLNDPRLKDAVQKQMGTPIGRLYEGLIGKTIPQSERSRLRKWAEQMSRQIPPDHDAQFYLDAFKNNGIEDTFDF